MLRYCAVCKVAVLVVVVELALLLVSISSVILECSSSVDISMASIILKQGHLRRHGGRCSRWSRVLRRGVSEEENLQRPYFDEQVVMYKRG